MRVRFRALTTKRLKDNSAQIQTKAIAIMRKHGQEVIEDIREYPPVPAESKYIRTYELYNAWRLTISNTNEGIVMRISNDVIDAYGRPYAHWVQGQEQTWFHEAHGWKRVEDNAKRNELHRELRKLYQTISY